MDLSGFFSPISIDSFNIPEGALGENVITNCYDMSMFSKVDVIIFSISENDVNKSNLIRESLYSLFFKNNTFTILDLGELLVGNSKNDFNIVLNEVYTVLYKAYTPIVVLNSNQRFIGNTLSIYSGNKIRYTSINPFCFSEREYNVLSISKINFSVIGTQQYLFPLSYSDFINDNNFANYRLGSVRSNISIVEPCLRDTNVLNINISSVRTADAPEQKIKNPNGLYAEEFCQLCRYGGISDTAQLFAFTYDSNFLHEITALLIAQGIWFVFDGIISRYSDYPKTSIEECNKYIVFVEEYDLELSFYESKKSQRWWVQKYNSADEYVSCSYYDYQSICNGTISNEMLKIITTD